MNWESSEKGKIPSVSCSYSPSKILLIFTECKFGQLIYCLLLLAYVLFKRRGWAVMHTFPHVHSTWVNPWLAKPNNQTPVQLPTPKHRDSYNFCEIKKKKRKYIPSPRNTVKSTSFFLRRMKSQMPLGSQETSTFVNLQTTHHCHGCILSVH